jgi:hypothetical protein
MTPWRRALPQALGPAHQPAKRLGCLPRVTPRASFQGHRSKGIASELPVVHRERSILSAKFNWLAVQRSRR